VYPPRLREYAALTNSPILYWLAFQPDSHRIGGKWAYEWLIDFVNYPGLVALHPQSLKLILENLPKWKSPIATKNDYELFLDGASPGEQEKFHELIVQASNIDAVLFRDETTAKQWTLYQG
jgi:hypothetical protein